MRLQIPLIVVVLAAFALPAGTVATDTESTATVELTVETHLTDRADVHPGELPDPVPGTASCTVEVPVGADGGDVLDQAVADGCIDGWDYTEFDGARFVTSIDNLRAPGTSCLSMMVGLDVCDWWEYSVNGATFGDGIDDYEAQDGDENRWQYRNTFG